MTDVAKRPLSGGTISSARKKAPGTGTSTTTSVPSSATTPSTGKTSSRIPTLKPTTPHTATSTAPAAASSARSSQPVSTPKKPVSATSAGSAVKDTLTVRKAKLALEARKLEIEEELLRQKKHAWSEAHKQLLTHLATKYLEVKIKNVSLFVKTQMPSLDAAGKEFFDLTAAEAAYKAFHAAKNAEKKEMLARGGKTVPVAPAANAASKAAATPSRPVSAASKPSAIPSAGSPATTAAKPTAQASPTSLPAAGSSIPVLSIAKSPFDDETAADTAAVPDASSVDIAVASPTTITTPTASPLADYLMSSPSAVEASPTAELAGDEQPTGTLSTEALTPDAAVAEVDDVELDLGLDFNALPMRTPANSVAYAAAPASSVNMAAFAEMLASKMIAEEAVEEPEAAEAEEPAVQQAAAEVRQQQSVALEVDVAAEKQASFVEPLHVDSPSAAMEASITANSVATTEAVTPTPTATGISTVPIMSFVDDDGQEYELLEVCEDEATAWANKQERQKELERELRRQEENRRKIAAIEMERVATLLREEEEARVQRVLDEQQRMQREAEAAALAAAEPSKPASTVSASTTVPTAASSPGSAGSAANANTAPAAAYTPSLPIATFTPSVSTPAIAISTPATENLLLESASTPSLADLVRATLIPTTKELLMLQTGFMVHKVPRSRFARVKLVRCFIQPHNDSSGYQFGWQSKRKKATEACVLLNAETTLQQGLNGGLFHKHMKSLRKLDYPNLSHLAFSLVTPKRTLDIVVQDAAQCEAVIKAIRYFINPNAVKA